MSKYTGPMTPEQAEQFLASWYATSVGAVPARGRETRAVVDGGFTKIAWIRDPDVPAGRPALGRFECPCGTRIEDVEFGGPDRECGGCGRVWDGRGWLVSAPEGGE